MRSPATRLDLVRLRHRAGGHAARRRSRGHRRRRASRSSGHAGVAALVSMLDGDAVRASCARDEQRRRRVAESTRRRARSRADVGERSRRRRSAADVLAVQRIGRRAHDAAAIGRRSSSRRSARVGHGTRVRAPRLSRRRGVARGDRVAQPAARRARERPRPRRRPGQRYLLERKLDGETQDRDARGDAARSSTRSCRALSAACARQPAIADPASRATPTSAARGTMVLNAAFLVAPRHRWSVSENVSRRWSRGTEPHGFRFDFTGPWPPYHFVNELADGA